MQDAYLLDTNIASIAWDGLHPKHNLVRQRLATIDQNSISVCVITLAEVLYGLAVSPNINTERHNAVKRAMLAYKIWEINRHTTQIYAEIRGKLFDLYAPRDEKGRLTAKYPEDLLDRTTAKQLGIQENDLWIVSVAVQYDLHFITADKKLKRILDVAAAIQTYDHAEIWSLDA